MNEDVRKQVMERLDELRAQVATRLGGDASTHDQVVAEVDALRSLLEQESPDGSNAHATAGKLERRLLAWEAEHPQLTALAARLSRALEDAGL